MTETDAVMDLNSGSTRILNVLRGVIDPEYGYDIVDMGLIYRLEINAGKVNVVMTLPARDYPSRDYILMAMEKCIQRLPGINNLEIQLIWDPPWSPQKMTSRKAYVEFPDDHLWDHNE
jgi:metal-sulfur cluster biosynthetic enzyme